MTTEETKKLISEKTGIPADLIAGENAEQIITRARQLLAFKRENEEPAKKDPSELFASWIRANAGIEEATPEKILDDIAEEIKRNDSSYPRIPDGGNPYINGSTAPGSPEESFKQWFYDKSAFDPFKG